MGQLYIEGQAGRKRGGRKGRTQGSVHSPKLTCIAEAGQGITLARSLVPRLAYPTFGTYRCVGFSWPYLGLGVVGRPGLKLRSPYHIPLVPGGQAWKFLPLASLGLWFLEPFTDFGHHSFIYSGKTYVHKVYSLNLFLIVWWH